MKKTNKLNKSLSLTLLLTISFNQASFCMQTKEEIINIDELPKITNQNQQSLESITILGEIFQDVLTDNVFECLEIKDLKNINQSCKILNELTNKYLETAIRDSKKEISSSLNLNDFRVLSKKSTNFIKFQKMMPKFIAGTERTLNVHIKCDNDTLMSALEEKLKAKTVTDNKKQTTLKLNKNNINKFENIDLCNIFRRRDFIKDEIKISNAPFLITGAIILAPATLTGLISIIYLNNKNFNIIPNILLSIIPFISALKISLNKSSPSGIYYKIQDLIEKM